MTPEEKAKNIVERYNSIADRPLRSKNLMAAWIRDAIREAENAACEKIIREAEEAALYGGEMFFRFVSDLRARFDRATADD